jgi:catechol 2,3-dioxygenase
MIVPAIVAKPDFIVTRASHAVLTVRDLKASRAFYVDVLGLVVSDEDRDVIYLRGLEEACHHSLVLKEMAGAPSCERVGFRVLTEEDLDLAKAYFEKAGLPAEFVRVPFQERTLHVTDPAGTRIEICATMATRERQIIQFRKFKSACPMRLDHFQVLTPFVGKVWGFYAEMGFRTSEYVTEADGEMVRAIFLQRKGNPHDLVFVKNENGPRLHHVAFTVPETYHLLHFCDFAANSGFGANIEFGPQRHYSPGYAQFVYCRDPDGHRLELFTNHYQTMDLEEPPARWTTEMLKSMPGYGIPPPDKWRSEAMPFSKI